MHQEITRTIKRDVERELWGRAAGRCEFQGCNRMLYKSPITGEAVHLAEKAHIYSFSEKGPRGRGPFRANIAALNSIGNLLLACNSCHLLIDSDPKGKRYSAKLLKQFKAKHEERVCVVTGVDPNRKSAVITYAAAIGHHAISLQESEVSSALFPDWYPSSHESVRLGMNWNTRDSDGPYWATEAKNLVSNFERLVQPLILDRAHLSVFGLAPMPLLMKLGDLISDKTPCQVYQLHREPHRSWKWMNSASSSPFELIPPKNKRRPPALIISLSASISPHRIRAAMGPNVSIWELRIRTPNQNFLKSRAQLSEFREAARSILGSISTKHGNRCQISIFPAMPVAAAIEFGRVRMSKAQNPWIVYDQLNPHVGFRKALEM